MKRLEANLANTADVEKVVSEASVKLGMHILDVLNDLVTDEEKKKLVPQAAEFIAMKAVDIMFFETQAELCKLVAPDKTVH